MIQVNTDQSFVSDSPYLQVFDRLQEAHRDIDKNGVVQTLSEIDLAGGIKVIFIDAGEPFAYV